MSTSVIEALDGFMQRFLKHSAAYPASASIEYDPKWPSECYQPSKGDNTLVRWQPVKRLLPGSFADMQKALDLTIHPDITAYFSQYWSENIDAQSEQGHLQLLQAWNPEDFALLQQNLIGHILMKRRLRQPETLFFALTDEDDFILSVDNRSGAVMLEQVGLEPKQQIAPGLADFLQAVEPSQAQPCQQ